MNTKMLATIIVVRAVAAAGAVLPHALAQAGHGSGDGGHMSGRQPAATGVLSLENIHSKHVPMVLMSIDKAKEALESGDRRTVVAELNKAQQMLVRIHLALGQHVKPQFANGLCPIMGSPIDAARVT